MRGNPSAENVRLVRFSVCMSHFSNTLSKTEVKQGLVLPEMQVAGEEMALRTGPCVS